MILFAIEKRESFFLVYVHVLYNSTICPDDNMDLYTHILICCFSGIISPMAELC